MNGFIVTVPIGPVGAEASVDSSCLDGPVAAPADSFGNAEIPHIPNREGVLAFEWWSEDDTASISYVDGMILSIPMRKVQALELTSPEVVSLGGSA